jgi:hypothetical protein
MTDNAITDVKARIFEAAGGEKNFRRELPFIFRQAVDELLDAPRTRRLRLSELEPNEKAILGIKVEAALRYLLDFPRGLLDFQIGPHPVDVKFSIKTSWMIPPEAIGHICILISADEVRSRFSIGLARATEENLNKGRNRDGKTSFSAAGKVRIDWIAHDEAYPPNLWESVSPDLAQSIFEPPSGTMRLVRLLEVMEGQPVHRSTIHAVARQHEKGKMLARERIECPWAAKGRVMRGLAEKFGGDPDAILAEGVLLNVEDGWVLMLPDPDSPMFYVYAESAEDDGSPAQILEEYVDLVKALIDE